MCIVCYVHDPKKENDTTVLINAAIERFKERRVEIPAWDALQSLVQRAMSQAKASALKSINQGLGDEDGLRLDALLDGKDGKTMLKTNQRGQPENAWEIGTIAAEHLLKQGAQAILDEVYKQA